ncbi:unnamed protein product, partial [Meganyctiphanes norvegica]
FTLGINFALFTIISTASTYEILQNINIFQGQAEDQKEFSDIVYVIPLAISLFHIYLVCKKTHDLKNRAYDNFRIRLKEMLPEFLMDDDKEKEKLFKKVETLYKNLKDWPPQVRIYGGFIINYRILVGIIFFSFAYARVFYKINIPEKKMEHPRDISSTMEKVGSMGTEITTEMVKEIVSLVEDVSLEKDD